MMFAGVPSNRIVPYAVILACVLFAAAGLSATEIAVDDPMLAAPVVRRGPVIPVFSPDLKPLWLEAVARPDAETRRMALDTIVIAVERGMQGWEDAAGRFREVLGSDRDPRVRRAAARALVAIDDQESAADLVAAAERDGLLVALIVEPALARWRHAAMREVWRARLEDSLVERAMLLLAIDAVRVTRDAAAAEALLAIVRDPSRDVGLRLAAAEAASQVGGDRLSAVADELARGQGARAGLSRLLAVRLLGGQADESAIETLQRLARDPEPAVAAAGLARLDAIRPAVALPIAKGALESADAGLRRTAATIVSRPADRDTIELLGHLLGDRNPSLRRFVTAQLVAAGRDDSLREAVATQAMRWLEVDDWRGAEQAMLVLGSLDHEPAAARLVELLRHAREEVAVTAAWALRKLQAAEALGPMLARAEELERLTLAQTPVPYGDRQASQLHQAFGEAGYRAAEPLLRRHLAGPTPKGPDRPESARAAAVWALTLLHADEPDPALAKVLVERMAADEATPPELPLVRRMAAVGLGRMKAAEHLPALRTVAERDGVNSEIGYSCFWSIEQLTGEPIPEVTAEKRAVVGWFLQPLGPRPRSLGGKPSQLLEPGGGE
jgi:HEAT repeat protein